MNPDALFHPAASHTPRRVRRVSPPGEAKSSALRKVWLCLAVAVAGSAAYAQPAQVPQYSVYEITLGAEGTYTNPYVELSATARLTPPDSKNPIEAVLFWDGGAVWKFRFAPDRPGLWRWSVTSQDPGLAGETGHFQCVPSTLRGSIRPMAGHPHHFERQNGERFWFLGDTAWALFTDHAGERHDRDAAKRHITARAAQGFNVLHAMLLSEAGWGNQGGAPFTDLAGERINPAYWQEVDQRLAYLNEKGLVAGLTLAWGDKRGDEPYAWRRFPSREARERYARYIAARYSPFDVYFLVSGEWHAEIRARPGTTEAAVRSEFVRIGQALQSADPHGRMIGIHPMTSHGSVREFNRADWMSFGDYQQNYQDLHERVLQSRRYRKPVVNAEYGYLLRDRDGDGIPDKENSTSLDAMRQASWDITMAGGYLVTGFGTTYFGGNRDPGPFDLEAPKNKLWESQIGLMMDFFTSLEWWKLEPHDELLRCAVPRGRDELEQKQIRPPTTTYWCLAEPGRQYVLYLRGLKQSLELDLTRARDVFHVSQWNPRSGEVTRVGTRADQPALRFQPTDDQDWVIVLMKED